MERFLEYFIPERYVLDLKVDKIKKYIGGTVKVFGQVLAEDVKFHAVGLSVDEVLVDGKKVDFEVRDGALTLFRVPRSASCIEVGYHGSLNENMEGAYLSTYEYRGKTEVIVATQFESHYAREAFPCIDEPAAKAVFEVALTLPEKSDDMVLMNTDLKEKYNNTYVFESTPRMSTYLLAWVVGKFHGKTVTNTHGVEITTYCPLNQDLDAVDFANEVAARSLEFYDDNFVEPYPLKKCTQVALPDFEAGAMENWGLVTYRESMLLAGKNATLGTKKTVALTVAHELSHQWFGDLVTMQWWDDLWLNESFASVMEYYAVDAIYPEFKIWEGFFTGDCWSALSRDCLSGVQSVHQEVHDPAEIATLFDPAIVYSKGARLMLMLIRLMGWAEFCKGVADYFDKYKYGNTVGDDLWECLNLYARFDVRELMDTFITRPGYPVVTGDNDFANFTQRRFLIDGEMKKTDWPLVEIREDMSGHYVLNLNAEEFAERLARFDELGLEEKLRLLIDRNLVVKTELAESATLLPLIDKFKREESAAVWNVLNPTISGLKIFLENGSEEERLYKKFVKGLVGPKLAEIGVVTREGDDENVVRLRSTLNALDYYASTRTGLKGKDLAEQQDNLRTLAKLYDVDLEKIDAEIRGDVLDAKVALNPEVVDEYLDLYQKTADPEMRYDLLFAMTLVNDTKERKKVEALLGQTEVVKPQDQFALFIWLYRNLQTREEVFRWLTENWKSVRDMAGDKSVENYPRYTAAMIRTEKMYKMWQEFFEPMESDLAIARAIEMGKREIEARLRLIESDGPEVLRTIRRIAV